MGRYSVYALGMVFVGFIIHAATTYAASVPSWEDVYDGTVSTSSYSESRRESWHHGICTEEDGVLERQTSRVATKLCVTHTANLSFASHLPAGDGEGNIEYAVKRNGDDVYHLVTNIHTPAQPLLLSDGTMISSSIGDSTSLKLFRATNAHEKFIEKQTQTGHDSFNKTYTLDESRVEFIKDNGEDMIFGRAIAVSQNRNYATAEVYGRGIVTIDLGTGEVRMISTDRVSEYNEPNGNMRLAVSNDGKKVFAVSNNASLYRLYLADSYCGRESAQLSNEIEWPCDYIDFKDELHAGLRSHNIFYADIAEDLKTVSLYSWSDSMNKRVKTTLKPDSNSKRLEYLALGDSYSSGEGDTEKNLFGDKYYRPFTNREENRDTGVPREKCHVSTRSYPHKLAVGMDLALDDPKQWDTIACSGATAWDIKTQATDDYKGQGDRLRDYDYVSLKRDGLESFVPGRNKQIEFIRKYKPKVITLTAGGNDIGFATRITECAIPNPTNHVCSSATDSGKMILGKQIKNQFDNLKSLYTELRKASSARTKIYVVGYPSFINGDERGFLYCGDNTGSLTNIERQMMQSAVSYLNNTIEQASKAAGVKYLDVEDSLEGGRLCDEGQRYMTGVTGIVPYSGHDFQESYHPNARGHLQMAMSIWDAVDSESLIDYKVCGQSSSTICPDQSVTKDEIEVPEFFRGPELAGETRYQVMTFDDLIKEASARLSIVPGLLQPNSIVQVVLHSDPVDIGQFVVDSSGQLSAEFAVPNKVPPGYHTLKVSGYATNGMPIELEQIVLVLGSDSQDRDEDGTLDSQQVCGPFIKDSGVDGDNDGIDDACDPEIAVDTSGPIVTPSPSPSATPTPSPSPEPDSGGMDGNIIVSFISQLITIIVGIIKLVITIIQRVIIDLW